MQISSPESASSMPFAALRIILSHGTHLPQSISAVEDHMKPARITQPRLFLHFPRIHTVSQVR